MKNKIFRSLLFRTIFLATGFCILCLFNAFSQTPGDVNADGVINFVDTIRILDHLIGKKFLVGDEISRADSNEDENVDVADIVWTVTNYYTPPVAYINGRIEVPENTPLDANKLTLISPGGDVPLNAVWEFSNMPVWDNGAGQFFFLEDATSNSLLMMYVAPDEIKTSPLVITTTNSATALIAIHPVCFSLDDRQRREFLNIAKNDNDFSDIILLINQALETSPTLLSDYDSFPAIYELAGVIGNNSARDWKDSKSADKMKALDIGLFSQIGRSQDPHLNDWPGNGMTLVNPHLLFYGVQFGGGDNQWTVIRGKDGLTQLIPPGCTPDVTKEIALADGNFTIEFWKGQGAYWSSNPAERAGSHANVFKTLLRTVDTLAPPGFNLVTGVINNNELIEFLATNPSEKSNQIITIWEALNITEADDVITVFGKIIKAMVNDGVYEGSLTQKLAQLVYNIKDTDGRTLWRYFKNANTWLDNVVKILKVYDIFNEFVPYFGQVFLYPNHYSYQINVNNGLLSPGLLLIPPEAQLTGSTPQPKIGETVNFDASASTDDIDLVSLLWFRFDFEGDRVWDTEWAQGNATASHAYTSIGRKTCIIEVKDSDNLTGRACYYLYVHKAGLGMIEVDVTPDSGQWRLLGPSDFTPIIGTDDRKGGSAIINASVGTYTLICYDNVPDYNPPPAQNKTLVAGGNLLFIASWTPEGVSGNIEMVYVPSGTFTMGARDDGDDTYRDSDELPRHEVTLSAYYIGKYEITNGQYCEVLNWAMGKGFLENSTGSSYTGGNVYKNENIILDIGISYCQIVYSGGSFTWRYRDGYSMENHPVVYVSWYGAVAFCNWLSEKEGKTPAYNLSTWELVNKTGGGYRLPTEAEWERAAAWDGSKHWIYGYTSDNGNNRNRYNHYDDLGGTGYVNPLGLSDIPYTSPVGWFNGVNVSPNGSVQTINSPSPVGCYDMSGNVWEWCHDWYSSTYYQGGAIIDPNGPVSGSDRVTRGGSGDAYAQDCRCAYRSIRAPSDALNNLGFRVCLQAGGN